MCHYQTANATAEGGAFLPACHSPLGSNSPSQAGKVRGRLQACCQDQCHLSVPVMSILCCTCTNMHKQFLIWKHCLFCFHFICVFILKKNYLNEMNDLILQYCFE